MVEERESAVDRRNTSTSGRTIKFPLILKLKLSSDSSGINATRTVGKSKTYYTYRDDRYILTEIDLTTIKRFIYYILQQGEIYQSLWIFLYLMITVFG